MEVDTSGGPRLKVTITECDGPQCLIGVEDDCPRNVVLGDLVNCLGLNLQVGVLTLVWLLGNNDVAGTLLREDVGCALEEQTVGTGRPTQSRNRQRVSD